MFKRKLRSFIIPAGMGFEQHPPIDGVTRFTLEYNKRCIGINPIQILDSLRKSFKDGDLINSTIHTAMPNISIVHETNKDHTVVTVYQRDTELELLIDAYMAFEIPFVQVVEYVEIYYSNLFEMLTKIQKIVTDGISPCCLSNHSSHSLDSSL